MESIWAPSAWIGAVTSPMAELSLSLRVVSEATCLSWRLRRSALRVSICWSSAASSCWKMWRMSAREGIEVGVEVVCEGVGWRAVSGMEGSWGVGGWMVGRGVWAVVVGEEWGVVCIGVVVSCRLCGGLGVWGLAMVGVIGDWVVRLGLIVVGVVLVERGVVLVVAWEPVGVVDATWGVRGGVCVVVWELWCVATVAVVGGSGGIPWSSSSSMKSPGWGWGGSGPRKRFVAWEKVYGRGITVVALFGLRPAASRKLRM